MLRSAAEARQGRARAPRRAGSRASAPGGGRHEEGVVTGQQHAQPPVLAVFAARLRRGRGALAARSASLQELPLRTVGMTPAAGPLQGRVQPHAEYRSPMRGRGPSTPAPTTDAGGPLAGGPRRAGHAAAARRGPAPRRPAHWPRSWCSRDRTRRSRTGVGPGRRATCDRPRSHGSPESVGRHSQDQRAPGPAAGWPGRRTPGPRAATAPRCRPSRGSRRR